MGNDIRPVAAKAANSPKQGEPWGYVFSRFLKAIGGEITYQSDLFEGANRKQLWMQGATIVPHGRSLQRPDTDALAPRILVDLRVEGVPRGYRNRVFIGYSPKLKQLEIIAPNERGDGNGGATDFFVVRNFGPGLKPELEYVRPGVCNACHVAGQPLFPVAPWSETVIAEFAHPTAEFQKRLQDNGLPEAAETVERLREKFALSNFGFDSNVREDAELLGVLAPSYRGKTGPLTSAPPTKLVDRAPKPGSERQFTRREDPLFLRLSPDPTETAAHRASPLLSRDPKERFPVGFRPKKTPHWTTQLPNCESWKKLEGNASPARAEAIFEQKCSECHDGMVTTSLSAAELATFVGDAHAERTPTALIENCLMPPAHSVALTNQERADLMAFIRESQSATLATTGVAFVKELTDVARRTGRPLLVFGDGSKARP